MAITEKLAGRSPSRSVRDAADEHTDQFLKQNPEHKDDGERIIEYFETGFETVFARVFKEIEKEVRDSKSFRNNILADRLARPTKIRVNGDDFTYYGQESYHVGKPIASGANAMAKWFLQKAVIKDNTQLNRDLEDYVLLDLFSGTGLGDIDVRNAIYHFLNWNIKIRDKIQGVFYNAKEYEPLYKTIFAFPPPDPSDINLQVDVSIKKLLVKISSEATSIQSEPIVSYKVKPSKR